MNNIRLIVTDMDGTLLDDKQQLTDETIQVFKQVLQQGIGVVLASGRNLSSLLSYGEQLSLSLSPLSGYITLNGLELYNSKFQCIKKYQRLRFRDILSFYQISLKYNIPLIVFYETGSYLLNGKTIDLSYLVDTTFLKPITLKQLENIDENQLLKIVLCGHEEHIEFMLNHLSNDIYQQYEISKVEKQWIEINPQNITKGNGLKDYLTYDHMTSDEIVVFGNGENDLSMLLQTQNSVAVENALETVKSQVTYICLNHLENGVAKFIKEKIL